MIYKTGTVTTSNGSATITGANTQWVTAAVRAGDLFSEDNDQFYEIQSVDSETSLTLASNFLGTGGGGQHYGIIRITATDGDVSGRLADLMARWHRREDEMTAWLAGTTTGGPNSDGRYPLTDLEGNTTLVKSPAWITAVLGDPTVDEASEIIAALSSVADAAAPVIDNIDNINEVAGNAADITTVAGIHSAVSTVATVSTQVSTVSGISSNVTTVAGIASDVTAVKNVAANVTTVAGIASDVTAVKNVAANVTTVASISTNVSAVAGISGNVTTVAGVSAAVSTVAGVSAGVTTVAGISTAVSTVAGIHDDVSDVAAIGSDVTTVAGISAAVTAAPTYAAAAAASASDAETAKLAILAGYKTSSTTSFSPEDAFTDGQITLTVETGKAYSGSEPIVVGKHNHGTVFIEGRVFSYDPIASTNNLVITVSTWGDDLSAGPYNNWDVNLGGIAGQGVRWAGPYDSGTFYLPYDLVSDAGSTWICVLATTGHAPPTLPTTSNTYWQLVAADSGLTDAELAAIAGLTSAADKGIYFTGSGTAATFDLVTAGRTFLGYTTAALQFAGIKQNATTSATGVVGLADDAAALAGTSTTLAVTPHGLAAAVAANPPYWNAPTAIDDSDGADTSHKYVAVDRDILEGDSTSAKIYVQLPATGRVRLEDAAGTFDTNSVFVYPPSGETIMGDTANTPFECDIKYFSGEFRRRAGGTDWRLN